MRWRLVILMAMASLLVIAMYPTLVAQRRAMFHNNYESGGLCLLPCWQPSLPLLDRRGQFVHVDTVDNTMVLLITGLDLSEGEDFFRRKAGLNESQFRIGKEGTTVVSVARQPNAIIVILPNGKTETFRLTPGQAESFFFEFASKSKEVDLSERLRSLLDIDEQGRFASFLENR